MSSDYQEKLKAAQAKANAEGIRMAVAEQRSKARLKMLDAAVLEGNPKSIEQARLESVAAFEAFLDARIVGNGVIADIRRSLV